MRTRFRAGGRAFAALSALALSAFACSLLVETRSDQCDTDADCKAFPHAACDTEQHVCKPAREVACEKEGCVCDPKTPTDLLNTCTDAERHCFDASRAPALDKLPPPPKTEAGSGGALGASACTGGASAASSGSGGSGGGSDGGAGGNGCPGSTAPPCSSTSKVPIYITGSNSLVPLLSWAAQVFAAKNPPVSLVYRVETSCTAVADIYASKKLESACGNEAITSYFTATGNQLPCRIGENEVIHPVIAASDVFAATCGNALETDNKTVNDTVGPVQAFAFVVPDTSDQDAISYEAAYMVYGFGSTSHVDPWDDATYIYEPDLDAGARGVIAATLGLASDKLRATLTESSNDEAALVGCSPMPEKTIGILPAALVEDGVGPIKLLAYQHAGQTCGYFPDSSRGTNDKVNVRDGHYDLWGPIHMIWNSASASDDAQELMRYLAGTSAAPHAYVDDLFQHWADARLVPLCAMHVTRKKEGGPLETSAPANACSCKYDEATSGTSACKRCTESSSGCHCSYGFCEPT